MKLPAEPITDPSKLDSVREHELYRYFIPLEASSTSLSASAASSPDTALTALAQLCAIRLHAKRAMVSVIGRETQYFVAESTKTLDLVDNQKYEVEGDSLWFGCGSVDKAGRLCEQTIELPPALGRAPCFTVTDLSKDERFNQLTFVSGPPYFKFYAGTVGAALAHSLRNRADIRIALDHKKRDQYWLLVRNGRRRPALPQCRPGSLSRHHSPNDHEAYGNI